jgi:hypothetical protein
MFEDPLMVPGVSSFNAMTWPCRLQSQPQAYRLPVCAPSVDTTSPPTGIPVPVPGMFTSPILPGMPVPPGGRFPVTTVPGMMDQPPSRSALMALRPQEVGTAPTADTSSAPRPVAAVPILLRRSQRLHARRLLVTSLNQQPAQRGLRSILLILRWLAWRRGS